VSPRDRAGEGGRVAAQELASVKSIRRSRRRASGFTLVEVILAIALVTVGFLGAMSLVTSTSVTNRRAREESAAYRACRHELENLRGMSWSALTTRTNAAFVGDVPELSELSSATGQLTIATYNSDPSIRRITLTVSWSEPRLGSQSWSMTTLVGSKGLVRP
jgi:prepilin-type N-terminal cleavage/methylation domain-containing protein